MLPWDDPDHTRKDVAPGKVWRYSAQAGVYHLSVITKMLEDKIGAHEAVPKERKSGKCRLFDIGFNEEGIPQPATFMLSLSAWSAAQILRHDRGVYALHAPLCSDVSDLPAPNDSLPLVDSGFYDFDNLTLHLMQWVDIEAYRLQEEGQKADTGWLKTLEKLVIAKLYFPEEAMDTSIVSVVKCSLTRKAKVIQEDSAKKDNKKKLEKHNADNELRSLERELTQVISNCQAVCKEQEQNNTLLKQAISDLGASWPERDATDEQRELSAPWLHERWRKAREDVFIAALDVHRAFIENNPVKMAANIGLAMDWLKGRKLTEKQAALTLDSLSLVVPVISSTFASMPRMFRDAGQEAIGWLLIDEAGQAQPQHAIGAIWRAKRTVLVGDPKQLEPVSSIPSTVEGVLAKHYQIPSCWWPGKVSAQILADQTMDVGTYLPDPESEQIWVGCPLRVHRRCDEPMFSISNHIAYDGLMVHGKKPGLADFPESGWLDVKGRTCEGNWVAELEPRALARINAKAGVARM
ncbi:AAA domain-containing protein [Klebsiella pneumoniae]